MGILTAGAVATGSILDNELGSTLGGGGVLSGAEGDFTVIIFMSDSLGDQPTEVWLKSSDHLLDIFSHVQGHSGTLGGQVV